MRFIVPEKVITQFHIRDGDTVADFGAGSGHFTKVLSRAAGSGKVYACEIQKQLVETIADITRTEGLGNVEVVWCDVEAERGTKLADDTLDVAIMVNTFFQIQDKAAALKEMARVLRTGGKFFVVDWTDSFGGIGPEAQAVVTKERARELIEQHGFTFEREFPSGDHHYGIAFRK